MTKIQHVDSVDTESVNADDFAVIVLAAGLSNRMGDTNKLLLKLAGQSLLQRCVAAVEESGVGEALVVLGHDLYNTERELANSSVRFVFNPLYEKGQMSSVQCGMNALSGQKKATLICLSDQPLLTAQHLKMLMWAFDNKPADKQIVVPMHDNQRGNPVVLSELVRSRLLQQGRNPGCRRYIDKNPDLVHWVSFNDAAYTTDVDTPDEFAAVRDDQSRQHDVRNAQASKL